MEHESYGCLQELENHLHSQKTRQRDELKVIAERLMNAEVLKDSVSSHLSAYEQRYNTLVSQVCMTSVRVMVRISN